MRSAVAGAAEVPARRRSARGTPGEGPRPTRARGVDFAAPIAEASLADDREACGGGGPGGPDRLSQLRDNKNDNDNNDNDNDDNSFILIMMMIIYHSNDNDDNDDSVPVATPRASDGARLGGLAGPVPAAGLVGLARRSRHRSL